MRFIDPPGVSRAPPPDPPVTPAAAPFRWKAFEQSGLTRLRNLCWNVNHLSAGSMKKFGNAAMRKEIMGIFCEIIRFLDSNSTAKGLDAFPVW
jgi:hypothetical protein